MASTLIEIERKFLVASEDYKAASFLQERIVQAYLNSDPKRSVRIRIKGANAFLTIKGESKDGGRSRFEWEKKIPVEEANELLKLCEPGKIEKTRFLVKFGEHTFEVDEFYGENEGLQIAEVELKSVEEDFQKPEWLGQEVTGNKKYYNAYLSKKPFKDWR